MKRRLTLAIGCLAAAMPSIASTVSHTARTVNVAQATRRMNLPSAAHAVQAELERRGLESSHTIASVVFLKGASATDADSGHYDVRIEPPATLADGARLRGFAVAMDGRVEPVTGFRVSETTIFSTAANLRNPEQSGLRSEAGEG
jgi:hypothetical protein